MKTVREQAWGKLNLTLDILGKRDDGYHEMSMIMQSVDLCDPVTVEIDTGTAPACICPGLELPQDRKNLALRAAEAYFAALGHTPDGYRICIEKHIPVQGGMAGGSSDAAAVLRGLQTLYGAPLPEEKLYDIAASLGSDVPYCLLGKTALAQGRGEKLTVLPPMPPCFYVLIKPDFSVPTPELFAAYDAAHEDRHPDTASAVRALEKQDLNRFCGCMFNCFQPILEKRFPVIGTLCRQLKELGALQSSLTGTGSVVYGVFDREETATSAAGNLPNAILAHNV